MKMAKSTVSPISLEGLYARMAAVKMAKKSLEDEEKALWDQIIPRVTSTEKPDAKGSYKKAVGSHVVVYQASVQVVPTIGAEGVLKELGIYDRCTETEISPDKISQCHDEGMISDAQLVSVLEEKKTYRRYFRRLEES